ncbi:PAS domain S-box protein [Halobacteriales archaeon Cl-PHB]
MTGTDPDSYEAIVEASPDAIVLVDAGGDIVYANARVADLLGYDPAELVGDPIEVLVPEADRDGHVADREAFIADPETRRMSDRPNLQARRKDGSLVPVAIHLSPVDGDGEARVMAAIRDVSDRVAVETKYRSILAAVPDAVVVADAESGVIVEANDSVTDLLGYEPSDLVGKPQVVLHPSGEEARYRDLFATHATEGTIRTQLADGGPIHVETADGEQVPVEINAQLFDLGDRRLVAGVFRDVTAARERRRQLRTLHETTRRFLRADRREEIADIIVDAARAILGFPRAVVRLVDGGDLLQPVAVSDQARVDMGSRPAYPTSGDVPVSRAFSTGDVLTYDDVRELDDDFDRGAARAALYLPLGESGVLSIVDTRVGTFDQADVELASNLAATAELVLARVADERALERQNARLDEFTSVVSHDLRNPLAVAQGWLDVACQDHDSEALDHVQQGLDRMDAIIEDSLTLARQGQAVDDVESVDLGWLASECWEMVATADADLTGPADCTILADRDRLRHVFENLFRNAVEHGGRDVTVEVGSLPQGGFFVEDDGPGVPEADREKLFVPGESTTDDGSGFGLAIIKQVAEAHGWSVDLTEGKQGGARFEFTDVDLA